MRLNLRLKPKKLAENFKVNSPDLFAASLSVSLGVRFTVHLQRSILTAHWACAPCAENLVENLRLRWHAMADPATICRACISFALPWSLLWSLVKFVVKFRLWTSDVSLASRLACQFKMNQNSTILLDQFRDYLTANVPQISSGLIGCFQFGVHFLRREHTEDIDVSALC